MIGDECAKRPSQWRKIDVVAELKKRCLGHREHLQQLVALAPREDGLKTTVISLHAGAQGGGHGGAVGVDGQLLDLVEHKQDCLFAGELCETVAPEIDAREFVGGLAGLGSMGGGHSTADSEYADAEVRDFAL
jgi:hypothetical protein